MLQGFCFGSHIVFIAGSLAELGGQSSLEWGCSQICCRNASFFFGKKLFCLENLCKNWKSQYTVLNFLKFIFFFLAGKLRLYRRKKINIKP